MEANTSVGLGGGLWTVGGNVTITNSTFADNNAEDAGGAIAASDRATVSINKTNLTTNVAAGPGGAFYGLSPAQVAVSGNTVSGNAAGADGGAFWQDGGSLNITDVTVHTNIAQGSGGAVAASNGTLEIINSQLSSNQAQNDGSGGAVYLGSGGLLMNDVEISSNVAVSNGGGLFLGTGATATVELLTLQSNRAVDGAGLWNDGTFSITTSTIAANTASGQGGGVFSGGNGQLTTSRSTLSGNAATDGGGLFDAGTVELTNSTVSNNTATGAGGGLRVTGTTTLNSVTVAANAAATGGGASVTGALAAGNTLIGNNTASSTAPDLSGTLTSQGHNLLEDPAGATISGGSDDLVGVDPRLGSLADNGGATQTHALLSGSPALGAGETDLTVDQRGYQRSDPDAIGAFALDAGTLSSFSFTLEGSPGHAENGYRGEDAGFRMMGFPSGPTYLGAIADEGELTFDVGDEDSGEHLAYFWDAATASWAGISSNPAEVLVEAGQGFLVFVFDDSVDPVDPTLTLDTEGVSPSSSVPAGNTATGSFLLLANPYDEPYDLSTLSASSSEVVLHNTVQIWQPAGGAGPMGSYISISRTGQGGDRPGQTAVPAWQGFFAELSGNGSGHVTFAASGEGQGTPIEFIGHTGPGTARAQQQDEVAVSEWAQASLHLEALDAEGAPRTADGRVHVLLTDAASESYDLYDASKRNPIMTGAGYAALAVARGEADGETVLRSIDAQPFPQDGEVLSVPLSVQAGDLPAGTSMRLALDSAIALDGYQITLRDLETGAVHDFADGPFFFEHDGEETAQPRQQIATSAQGRAEEAAVMLGQPVPMKAASSGPHFVLELHRISVATEQTDGLASFHLSAPQPNPAASRSRLTLRIDETQHVRAHVYDALGRRVATLHEGPLTPGANLDLVVEGDRMPAGVYAVRVEGETFAATRRLVIVR